MPELGRPSMSQSCLCRLRYKGEKNNYFRQCFLVEFKIGRIKETRKSTKKLIIMIKDQQINQLTDHSSERSTDKQFAHLRKRKVRETMITLPLLFSLFTWNSLPVSDDNFVAHLHFYR